jgi:ParB family chromosome partitioning protein
MASIKQIAEGRKDLFMIDPRLLREEDGWNVRVNTPELQEHIEQLALSIAENGVLEPLTVYWDGETPVVTNGHCRRMATLLAISRGAEIAAVPVRVEERYSNEADRVLSMITRNSGKPLSMLEQAEVVKRLAAFGWDKKKIASKAGKSVQHIENILVLAGSPEELKRQVAQGDVSASNAVSLAKKHGNKASEVVKDAVEKTGKKITARQTAISVERSKIAKWIAAVYPAMHEAFLSEFPVED